MNPLPQLNILPGLLGSASILPFWYESIFLVADRIIVVGLKIVLHRHEPYSQHAKCCCSYPGQLLRLCQQDMQKGMGWLQTRQARFQTEATL